MAAIRIALLQGYRTLTPTQHTGSTGQAGAKGGQQYAVTWLDATGFQGLYQRNRYGRGGGVAIILNIHLDLRHIHRQVFCQ